MNFNVEYRCGAARSGVLKLRHGKIQTPVFMPVGTYGAVKGVSPEELESNGAQIILGNTFQFDVAPRDRSNSCTRRAA